MRTINWKGFKMLLSDLVVDRITGATVTLDAGSIGTSELADGSVSAVKARGSQSVTATADGLTTGLITAPTALMTVVTVTSGGATDAVTLPAPTAANVGSMFLLLVTSNGYELLTPASGNATINQVDADGTNQLDVAANTALLVIQSTATGYLAIQIAAATITVVAPDND
jgi:hypothetical protein